MKRYAANWDTVTKAITSLLLAIVVGLLSYDFFAPANDRNHLYAGIIVLVAVIITWLTSPAYYSTDAEGITVHRRGGSLDIPYRNIKSIQRVYKGELGRGLRLFGSGGLFGYLGVFWYGGSAGRVNMNCSNRYDMVLIDTGKSKIMISPENPEAFVEDVKQHLPQPRS